jgi:hypothetical protein
MYTESNDSEQIAHVSGGPAEPERDEQSRRQFLKMLGIAGVGIAGVATASQEAAAATPPATEDLRAVYEMNQNQFRARLSILNQTGNNFSGTFEYGNEGPTPVSGTVTGKRPGPVTVIFNRIWAPPVGDGTVQTHFGAAALTPGTDTPILLAGVFYHNGLGPFPWTASGYHVG